jgi:hypothetical protein
MNQMLATLESYPAIVALRQSAWAYPLVSWTHVLGLGLLFGSICVVDLRLAGWLRKLDRTAVLASLPRVALTGFVVAAVSGMLLFVPAGREYLANPYFIAKLVLIGVAGANAVTLHLSIRAGIALGAWPLFPVVSMLLWAGVILAGRMLAFG